MNVSLQNHDESRHKTNLRHRRVYFCCQIHYFFSYRYTRVLRKSCVCDMVGYDVSDLCENLSLNTFFRYRITQRSLNMHSVKKSVLWMDL